jgi:hypothetical protein
VQLSILFNLTVPLLRTGTVSVYQFVTGTTPPLFNRGCNSDSRGCNGSTVTAKMMKNGQFRGQSVENHPWYSALIKLRNVIKREFLANANLFHSKILSRRIYA